MWAVIVLLVLNVWSELLLLHIYDTCDATCYCFTCATHVMFAVIAPHVLHMFCELLLLRIGYTCDVSCYCFPFTTHMMWAFLLHMCYTRDVSFYCFTYAKHVMWAVVVSHLLNKWLCIKSFFCFICATFTKKLFETCSTSSIPHLIYYCEDTLLAALKVPLLYSKPLAKFKL